jgi:hypothetical protein
LQLRRQSTCLAGLPSLPTSLPHCVIYQTHNYSWFAEQCGNCFLRLCQFENTFNPTMMPCASKYYADIWPCYKDHYKQ